jgi:hypothetical protein
MRDGSGEQTELDAICVEKDNYPHVSLVSSLMFLLSLALGDNKSSFLGYSSIHFSIDMIVRDGS